MPRRKPDSTAVEQQANQNPDLQEVDTALETTGEQATSGVQEQTVDQNSEATGEANSKPVSDQEATTSPPFSESNTQTNEQPAKASDQQEQLPAQTAASQLPAQTASQSPDDTASGEQSNPDSRDDTPAKPKSTKSKKERVSVPKQEFTMILDGGRSQIKVLVLLDNQVVSTLVLESTICQVDAPPFGELAAFYTVRKK